MTQYTDRAGRVAEREIRSREAPVTLHELHSDMVMTYNHQGKTHAHMIDMKLSRGLIIRTLVWASRLGLEVTFRKP